MNEFLFGNRLLPQKKEGVFCVTQTLIKKSHLAGLVDFLAARQKIVGPVPLEVRGQVFNLEVG